MGALSKIEAAGFNVSLAGENLEISPASALTLPQREFLKSHKAEIIAELKAKTLSAADQQKLIDYMAAIGETDQGLIDGLLNRCVNDADYLKWILDWANKLLSPSRRPKTQTVSCRGCRYFKCLNAHGGGAGKCGIGARSAGYYNWSDDLHECSEYLNRDQ